MTNSALKHAHSSLESIFRNLACDDVGRFYITPKVASIILNHHNYDNRRMDYNNVQKFVTSFNGGSYEKVAMSLIFTKQGRLIDGQHRLKALTITEKTLPFRVEFDATNDSIMAIDTGKQRTVANTLSMHGVKDSSKKERSWTICLNLIHSSFKNKLCVSYGGGIASQKMPKASAMKVICHYDDLISEALKMQIDCFERIESPFKVASIFATMLVDVEEAKYFWLLMNDEEPCDNSGIEAIKKELRKLSSLNRKRGFVFASYYIQAWNMHKNPNYEFNLDSVIQEFKKIHGLDLNVLESIVPGIKKIIDR